MRKILSTVLLLAVIATMTLVQPVQVYACNCNCKSCKSCKNNNFSKKTEATVDPVKKFAKKYNWETTTSVVSKKAKKKLLTKVYFQNTETQYEMTVYVRATKKNGKIGTEWIFKRDGKWLRTNAKLIKGVLKRDGKKA